jgi:hypothetical protein
VARLTREMARYCESIGLRVLDVRAGKGSHEIITLGGPLGSLRMTVSTRGTSPRLALNLKAQARRAARALGAARLKEPA